MTKVRLLLLLALTGCTTSGGVGEPSPPSGILSGDAGGAGDAFGGAPDASYPDASAPFAKLEQLSKGWAPNEWHELANSHLEDVFLSRAATDAIDPKIWEVTGPASSVVIWASGAFDGQKLYLGTAGGHGGYNGNEIYNFDFSTLAWTRMYDPAPTDVCTPSGGGEDCTTKWGPQAVHHYDSVIYSSKANALFLFDYFHSACWEWPLAEKDASKGWKKFPCFKSPLGETYMKTAEDPTTKNIVVVGGGQAGAVEFDPVTLEWSKYTGGGQWSWADYGVMDIDPLTRRSYFFAAKSGGGHSVAFVDDGATALTTGQGVADVPSGAENYACFIYHAKSKKFIAWSGDERLWSYDQKADLWATVPTTGVTPGGSPVGPLQRCAYLPSVDLFVGYAGAARGMFAIRASL